MWVRKDLSKGARVDLDGGVVGSVTRGVELPTKPCEIGVPP